MLVISCMDFYTYTISRDRPTPTYSPSQERRPSRLIYTKTMTNTMRKGYANKGRKMNPGPSVIQPGA